MTQSDTGLFKTATDQDAVQRAVAAAAPAAVERVDLAMVHSLDPGLRQPMYALLSSLADNKYMLGRRYAEWCTGAPMLESAVAAAAMAQDELGHARSFYPLLRGFSHQPVPDAPKLRDRASAHQLVPDAPQLQDRASAHQPVPDAPQMEERGWQQRQTSALACLDTPFTTWADFVAANLVVDQAFTTLLAAATDSPYEPLRQRARKIVQEETAHRIHAEGWLRHPASSTTELTDGSPAGPAAATRDLTTALVRVWDDAFTWFGQSDDPVLAPLAGSGLLAQPPDALRAALRARLEPVLTAAPRLRDRKLPWDRWDPVARRVRAP